MLLLLNPAEYGWSMWTGCHIIIMQALLLQIYQRAGYKAFRETHAGRGADFAQAVSACKPT